MGDVVITVGIAIAAFVVAFFIGRKLSDVQHEKNDAEKIDSAEKKARKIVDDAIEEGNAKKREALLEAKEENLRIKNDLDKEIQERRSEISKNERRIQSKEENLDRKVDACEKKEQALNQRDEALRKKQSEMDKLHQQRVQELERISGLTKDQAKDMLLKSLEADVQLDAAKLVKESVANAKEEAGKKAKDILVTAIQKCG